MKKAAEFIVQSNQPNHYLIVVFSVAIMMCSISLLSGCVTIMGGSPKGTPVTSEPAGAEVYIDGKPAGKTPVTVYATPPVFRNIDIEAPAYEPYRQEISKAFKREIHPLFFANIFAGGIFGFITDIATGSMYKYGYPLHVKMKASPAEKTIDPIEYFRIPELTAPSGQSLLVLYREPFGEFLFKTEDVYLDENKLSLKDAECKIIPIPPGPHSLGISRDEMRPISLEAGSTTYMKMEAQHAGTEMAGSGYKVKFYKLLNLVPEEEAIREAYYLLKRK